MKASDIMSPDPEVVTPDETLQRAAAMMKERDVGIIPVVEDRSSMKLAGVITDRDIVVRHVAEGHREDCSVGAHLSGDNVETVGPEAEIEEVTRLMQRRKVRRIPVVEEGGRLIGIISQADVTPQDPRMVAETVEKISEPASLRR